ncbi:MAG: hypothetical protein OEO79_00135 [Gemmatimonadota bacterium]|nr:hypothetical protein [Gemmatimonadota bacterium]MDH3424331.1 hypothetical protein [Gemmatimonadota bacterium]
MSRKPIDAGRGRIRLATLIVTIAVAACARSGATLPTGAVTGTLQFLERQAPDTAIGPVVVMLEPVDPTKARTRPTQQFRVTSGTDNFDPGFVAIGDGDFIVFANEGAVSHRLFSADLGPDLQIPVGPGDSSAPQQINYTGEVQFFCSLHPDENFTILATTGVFFSVLDERRRYYVGPLSDGSYRLSIWSPRLQGPVRTLEVTSGGSSVETIWLDPDLIRR